MLQGQSVLIVRLLAVVDKGDAKANLKITLEWGEELPTGIDENAGEQVLIVFYGLIAFIDKR